MKKTKDKILATALRLFNEQGLSQVTLRTIANELGISQGNLSYHYKKRHEIIELLYFQLVEHIDQQMTASTHAKTGLEILFGISKTIMFSFYNYRFFLLDFAQIIREHPTIKAHYAQLALQRQQQFATLFQQLVAEGTIHPEELPKQHTFLYQRLQILSDFWMSSAEILNKPLDSTTFDKYFAILSQEIYPYLTEKGQVIYRKLLA